MTRTHQSAAALVDLTTGMGRDPSYQIVLENARSNRLRRPSEARRIFVKLITEFPLFVVCAPHVVRTRALLSFTVGTARTSRPFSTNRRQRDVR
jgi:hypothetical protein